MNDRGVPLANVVQIFSVVALFSLFKAIVRSSLFLARCLPHGDVLPHNLVYDNEARELNLIDVDEGTNARFSLPSRNNEYTGEMDWYQALRYPNFFLKDGVRYTKVQLVACVLYIYWLAPNKVNLRSEVLEACENLERQAKDLGESMSSLEKKGETPGKR